MIIHKGHIRSALFTSYHGFTFQYIGPIYGALEIRADVITMDGQPLESRHFRLVEQPRINIDLLGWCILILVFIAGYLLKSYMA